MGIKKVWIVDGCISCNLCEDICPEVFEVPAGDVSRTVKGHEKLLKNDEELDERIQESVDSCPVEVIEVEKD